MLGNFLILNEEYTLEQVKSIELREIDEITDIELIFNNHYSKVMPRLTKIFLGGYINNELVAVLTLGWGRSASQYNSNMFSRIRDSRLL